jgi:hypothetical protein
MSGRLAATGTWNDSAKGDRHGPAPEEAGCTAAASTGGRPRSWDEGFKEQSGFRIVSIVVRAIGVRLVDAGHLAGTRSPQSGRLPYSQTRHYSCGSGGTRTDPWAAVRSLSRHIRLDNRTIPLAQVYKRRRPSTPRQQPVCCPTFIRGSRYGGQSEPAALLLQIVSAAGNYCCV